MKEIERKIILESVNAIEEMAKKVWIYGYYATASTLYQTSSKLRTMILMHEK